MSEKEHVSIGGKKPTQNEWIKHKEIPERTRKMKKIKYPRI